MYDTILLPTDGSLRMANALEHCFHHARQNDATVHTLYVVDIRSYVMLPEETGHRVAQLLEQAGRETLEVTEHRAEEENRPIISELRAGIPHEAILEYVDANDIDLIVMGTHGRTGDQKRIVGSVAEEVVRNSTVPVLTLPMSAVDMQELTDEIPQEQRRYTH